MPREHFKCWGCFVYALARRGATGPPHTRTPADRAAVCPPPLRLPTRACTSTARVSRAGAAFQDFKRSHRTRPLPWTCTAASCWQRTWRRALRVCRACAHVRCGGVSRSLAPGVRALASRRSRCSARAGLGWYRLGHQTLGRLCATTPRDTRTCDPHRCAPNVDADHPTTPVAHGTHAGWRHTGWPWRHT